MENSGSYFLSIPGNGISYFRYLFIYLFIFCLFLCLLFLFFFLTPSTIYEVREHWFAVLSFSERLVLKFWLANNTLFICLFIFWASSSVTRKGMINILIILEFLNNFTITSLSLLSSLLSLLSLLLWLLFYDYCVIIIIITIGLFNKV